jgi:hypothetical protein
MKVFKDIKSQAMIAWNSTHAFTMQLKPLYIQVRLNKNRKFVCKVDKCQITKKKLRTNIRQNVDLYHQKMQSCIQFL